MGKPITIQAGDLGDLPIFPPRRTIMDFTPKWLRRALRTEGPSPRELWYVSSQVLRTLYFGLYKAEAEKCDLLNIAPPTDVSELN